MQVTLHWRPQAHKEQGSYDAAAAMLVVVVVVANTLSSKVSNVHFHTLNCSNKKLAPS